MLSFKSFIKQNLFEHKLTHITHLEDLIYDNPVSDVVKQVEGILDSLTGGNSRAISLKVDGAPSLIAGYCPDTGKFFVATKSLFNKTPKINYTAADVDANHKGELADKLKYALEYLPKVFPRGAIMQGDFMFGGTNKGVVKQKIDGVDYLTFTPNSLTYAVPVSTFLALRINRAKIGIVWHTSYSGNTLANLTASAGADTSSFKKSPDVWTMGTRIQDASAAFFTVDEANNIRMALEPIKKLKVKMSSEVLALVNIFTNDQFHKVQTGTMKVSDFIAFVLARYQDQINKLKTQVAKDRKQEEFNRIKIEIESSNLQEVFNAHNILYKIKNVILDKLNKIKGFSRVFTQTSDGFQVANDEGYVYAGSSGNVVKIVDRIGFSLYNFQNSKMR